jgi:pimeloyl-ACP methyl ester carboxylesterase
MRASIPRIGGLLAVAYVLVCLLIAWQQRALIYFPPRLSTAALQPYADQNRLLPWTNAAGVRIAWWRPAPPATASRGVVLITHGNAGSAAGREYLFDPLQQGAALEVVVLEYPGYADRPGTPSQASLLAAAEELLAGVTNRFPGQPVYLVGESLGSGVASYLAGAHPTTIRGLLALVPYNNFTAVGAAHYPWLPIRWILQDTFPSEEWLRNYPGRLGVVVGERDGTVPARLGRALHEGFAGTKRLWSYPVDHFEACEHEPAWWRDAIAFLESAPSSLAESGK